MIRKLFASWKRRAQPANTPTGHAPIVPGVYVRERPDLVREIEPADLSAAAFAGVAAAGPAGQPVAVKNYSEFVEIFGQGAPGYLESAARLFFANGGQKLYVVRVSAPPDSAAGMETVLVALDALHDVGLLALPGVTTPSVLEAAARYCERRRQSLLLADCPADAHTVKQVQAHAAALQGRQVALYHPWLVPLHASGPVPPSGAVAGLLARWEREGRLWRAPSGPAATLAGVSEVEHAFGQETLGELVQHNVNPIRNLSGAIQVWGARTLSDNPEYRYVNVRRFVSFVEASVQRGIQWATFEPDGQATRDRVRLSIEHFLADRWRAGALQGDRPQDAWFVRCDGTTMTQADLNEGRVVALVGIAMLRPAEFIVLKIAWRAAGA